jgi:hypothetical protein
MSSAFYQLSAFYQPSRFLPAPSRFRFFTTAPRIYQVYHGPPRIPDSWCHGATEPQLCFPWFLVVGSTDTHQAALNKSHTKRRKRAPPHLLSAVCCLMCVVRCCLL